MNNSNKYEWNNSTASSLENGLKMMAFNQTYAPIINLGLLVIIIILIIVIIKKISK